MEGHLMNQLSKDLWKGTCLSYSQQMRNGEEWNADAKCFQLEEVQSKPATFAPIATWIFALHPVFMHTTSFDIADLISS